LYPEGRIPAWQPSGAAPEPYCGVIFDRLAMVLVAAAVLIGIGAVVDHHAKQARINRAEIGEWYCLHRGTRCGGPSSDRIEARWNERQSAYEAVVVALGATAVARVVLRARRR
jgi:hypothetical protein